MAGDDFVGERVRQNRRSARESQPKPWQLHDLRGSVSGPRGLKPNPLFARSFVLPSGLRSRRSKRRAFCGHAPNAGKKRGIVR